MLLVSLFSDHLILNSITRVINDALSREGGGLRERRPTEGCDLVSRTLSIEDPIGSLPPSILSTIVPDSERVNARGRVVRERSLKGRHREADNFRPLGSSLTTLLLFRLRGDSRSTKRWLGIPTKLPARHRAVPVKQKIHASLYEENEKSKREVFSFQFLEQPSLYRKRRNRQFKRVGEQSVTNVTFRATDIRFPPSRQFLSLSFIDPRASFLVEHGLCDIEHFSCIDTNRSIWDTVESTKASVSIEERSFDLNNCWFEHAVRGCFAELCIQRYNTFRCPRNSIAVNALTIACFVESFNPFDSTLPTGRLRSICMQIVIVFKVPTWNFVSRGLNSFFFDLINESNENHGASGRLRSSGYW